ncbi:MAG TPA: hypothetical protein VMR97_06050 [Acidimicrobiales bacterium]|nr:hypothetical protein [Acidimicrobiales bacterium]
MLKPSEVIPGPKGLVGGAPPQSNGVMLLLAGTGVTRNVRTLTLDSGSLGRVWPVSSSAVAIAQSNPDLVAVGLATTNTGAVEFARAASRRTVVATVPLGAPVRSVTAGADGTTFYALNGNTESTTVSVVNSRNHTVVANVPVPLGALAATPSANESSIYVLEPDGKVSEIQVATGKVLSAFDIGSDAMSLALGPNGTTLYVLRDPGAISEVGVVNLTTESVERTLPAPLRCVAIELSPDGTSLYDIVGAAAYGNVQIYRLTATKS